ncbi:MAG TPA: hypothetical protein VEB21_14630, partial [Terriglobales bacterium]|nr:hypothetical protein [Terriglobales bacterium]
SEPITVVLEDIHWIDTASLRALQALLPRLAASRAHVLASLRDEDAPPGSPVRVALDTLMRRSLVELIPLSGLPPPDRRELIAHLGGAAMPQDLVDRIAQSSEGSPFFIEEILRQYSGTATSAPAAGNIDPFLPANVVEVFERRRRRLSTNTQQLLEAIAVAGSECDELLLENLLPFADGELADAINEAIEHKVLRENPTHPGRYGFEHALMALAIYQRLTPPLRRRWHRDLAEAIADGSGDRAGEIARHLLRAVPAVPVDTTVDALLQAAHQATARLAYEDAIDNCAKALELIGGTGGDTTAHPRLAEVAVRHAEALQQIAEADRIAAAFRDAATIARHSADPQWFARAALGMATIWDFEAPDVREYLEQALARIDDSQAALRARLLARLAVVLYPLPDTRPRCEELSTQAVTLARQVGDATLLAQTLVDWLAGQWYQDNLPAQESFSEELLEVARRSGDGALMATAHGWRVVIALDAGDIARAEAESEALLQLAEKSARPLYRWCALYLSGTLALLHGDLEGGELLANAAFEFGRSASPQNATIVYSSQMVAVRREQDRINEIIDLVEQNPQRMSSDALVWLLPHFYVEADRWEDGRAAFDRALALGLDALPGENSRNRRLMAIGAIALACAAFDDKRAAAKLYPVVEVNAARWAVAGWGAVSYGMLANAAGALATCLGKYEDAAAHFERAIGEYERKRVRIALARAYYMYADMHLRRGARGDARRGKDLLAKARAIADECKLVRTRKLIARLSEAHART